MPLHVKPEAPYRNGLREAVESASLREFCQGAQHQNGITTRRHLRLHLNVSPLPKTGQNYRQIAVVPLVLASLHSRYSAARAKSSFNRRVFRSLFLCFVRQCYYRPNWNYYSHSVSPDIPIVRRTPPRETCPSRSPHLSGVLSYCSSLAATALTHPAVEPVPAVVNETGSIVGRRVTAQLRFIFFVKECSIASLFLTTLLSATVLVSI